MLDQIIDFCPDIIWTDTPNGPPIYKVVYHILYFVDLYFSKSQEERESYTMRYPEQENFNITKEIFDPSNVKSLTKFELKDYISDLKAKGKEWFETLSISDLEDEPIFEWHGSTLLSSLLYNLRHIMLHIGALQARLRQLGVDEQFWISKHPL
jgi:uncharacterized damage-inducible protein DinB